MKLSRNLFKNKTFRVHFTTLVLLLILFIPLTPSTNIQGKLGHVDKHIKVQAPDAGTLVKILIKEGEHVQKDQLLMVLNDSKVKTEFTVLNQQLAAYLCREASLKSILAKEKFNFPTIRPGIDSSTLSAYCGTEQRISNNALSNFNDKLYSLKIQISNLERELIGIEEIITVSQKNVEIQKQIYNRKKVLFDSDFLSSISLIESEKELIDSEQRLREKRNDLLSKTDRLIDLKRQLTDYGNDFTEKARTEYKNLSNEIDMLSERIKNINKTINGFEIKSPQSGTVLNITKNRVGNIFSSNEILLELVPDDEEIVVIANLLTADNYHVSAGQNAVIRLTTHNQSFSPEFEGVVSSISPDVKVESPNDPPSYQLTVKFPCDAQCKELYKMASGMPADIYLLGNKRSLISYLLDAVYSGSRNIITE
jgi:HlyD family type I secretion membrane fusion protein